MIPVGDLLFMNMINCLCDLFTGADGSYSQAFMNMINCLCDLFTGADGSYSQASDVGRKDSLSLNVEFVKVNLSRSRKGVMQTDIQSGGSTSKLSGVEPQSKAANSVRFSG